MRKPQIAPIFLPLKFHVIRRDLDAISLLNRDDRFPYQSLAAPFWTTTRVNPVATVFPGGVGLIVWWRPGETFIRLSNANKLTCIRDHFIDRVIPSPSSSVCAARSLLSDERDGVEVLLAKIFDLIFR